MSLFGEGVRARRTALGLTQAELAAVVRIRRRAVTPSYISRIERGLLDPRLSTVCAIARALGVQPWVLLAYPYSASWWETYLHLSPVTKRELQRVIKWYERK